MATHDGHDVHVSAQPAVHTPIDSDASSIQATHPPVRQQGGSMIWATLPHRNREHQPTVRCAIYTYLSLRRLGLEKARAWQESALDTPPHRLLPGRHLPA